MTTTGWHAPSELLEAYVDGRLDAVLGASLERHLDRCAACRGTIAPLTDHAVVERAWAGLRATVEAPARPWLVRVAERLGLPEPTGVLLAATASLRVAWLSGAFVALAFAAGAAAYAGGGALWPFLLVAPLVPVLGVAAAYGPAEDPFESLAVTAPYGRTRLVLLRTVAVLATSVPVACLLGLALPGPAWLAAAWLGPALSMLPLLLALASVVGPRAGAGVITLLWVGLVGGATRELPATWPVEATQQACYLVLAAAAVGFLVLRSLRGRRIEEVL